MNGQQKFGELVEAFERIVVTDSGTLGFDGYDLPYLTRLDVAGAIVARGESFVYLDEDVGEAHLSNGSSLLLTENATLYGAVVESYGSNIKVEAVADESETSGAGALFDIERFTARAGTSTISVGGDAYLEELEDASVAMAARAKVTFGELALDDDAVLRIEVGGGGRFWLRGAEGSSNDEQYFSKPFFGGAAVFQKSHTIGSNLFMALGGTDQERANASKQWNLWVGEGGVLAVEGDQTIVTMGEGTSVRFEEGSTVWVLSSAETSEGEDEGASESGQDQVVTKSGTGSSRSETIALDALDLKNAYVSGLENVSVTFDGDLEAGSLVMDADGNLFVQMGAPEFKGPLSAMLAEVYERRKDVTVPNFYRWMFTNSIDVVEATMMTIVASSGAAGTNERLMMSSVGTTQRLHSAFRTLERQAKRAEIESRLRAAEDVESARVSPTASKLDSSNETEDWFARIKAWKASAEQKIPEAMKNVPVMVSAVAGTTEVDLDIAEVGGKQTVKTDDTGFDLAVVFGKNDWRLGVAGTFRTHDLTLSDEGISGITIMTAESDEASASVFLRHPVGRGWATADFTWLEASDAYKLPIANTILSADDVKRTSYSAGLAYEADVLSRDHWKASAMAGLRYVFSESAQTNWMAPSGKVLVVEEGKRDAFIATLGGSIEGAVEFDSASGWFGAFKPRRMDAALSASLSGVSGSSRSVTAAVPGFAARGSGPDTGKPEHIYASIEVGAGVEWAGSRLDISGFAAQGGSSVRSRGALATLSWRFNSL